jgi:mxaJ protein
MRWPAAVSSRASGVSRYDDYRQPNPPARILTAVVDREIDIATVWGPLAGYFTKHDGLPLRLTPVKPAADGPRLAMVFDISMGVRRDDEDLWHEVSASLARHQEEIKAILADYGVPQPD